MLREFISDCWKEQMTMKKAPDVMFSTWVRVQQDIAWALSPDLT